MRGLAVAAAFAVSALHASPVLAQAAGQPAGQAKPAPPAQPAPPAPKPAAPAPAAPAAPTLPAPVPFATGAKIGFVNLQAIAQMTADGKAAAAKVNALAQKKQTEGAEKSKALQANQTKLQTGGTLLNEGARAQLEKEIERQQVEGQRFEQDAQSELQELQQELQQEFQKKLLPILEDLRKEKGLHLLLSAGDSGIIVFDPGIDLTLEAVKRMDTKAGAAK
jgi:outer membrane protein